MLYHALAVDYDGTLATNGLVDDATVDALVRLRQSGPRVVPWKPSSATHAN